MANWDSGDEISNYWKLCDEFDVHQASLLIVGVDPSSEIGSNCGNWKAYERPAGYEAAKHGVSSGLRQGIISGQNTPCFEGVWNGEPVGEIPNSTNPMQSMVDRKSLVEWLKQRGIKSGFFFPNIDSNTPDFLDSNNPRYAPKLAAAVQAWQSVVDPNGKTPKQALVKWLREHAARFGLTNDDGIPNETGIEEVAKVANWQPGGGAAKTPTGLPTHPTE